MEYRTETPVRGTGSASEDARLNGDGRGGGSLLSLFRPLLFSVLVQISAQHLHMTMTDIGDAMSLSLAYSIILFHFQII